MVLWSYHSQGLLMSMAHGTTERSVDAQGLRLYWCLGALLPLGPITLTWVACGDVWSQAAVNGHV